MPEMKKNSNRGKKKLIVIAVLLLAFLSFWYLPVTKKASIVGAFGYLVGIVLRIVLVTVIVLKVYPHIKKDGQEKSVELLFKKITSHSSLKWILIGVVILSAIGFWSLSETQQVVIIVALGHLIGEVLLIAFTVLAVLVLYPLIKKRSKF